MAPKEPSSSMSLMKGCVIHSVKPLSSNLATPTSFQQWDACTLEVYPHKTPNQLFCVLHSFLQQGIGWSDRNSPAWSLCFSWYLEGIAYLFFCSLSTLGITTLHVDPHLYSALQQPFITLGLEMQRLSNLVVFCFQAWISHDGGLWEYTFVGIVILWSYRLGIPRSRYH